MTEPPEGSAHVPAAPVVLVSREVLHRHGEQLARLLSPHEGQVVTTADVQAAPETEVTAAFFSVDASRSGELATMGEQVEACESLTWIHVGWAGVENPYFTAMAQRGVRLTSSAGAAAAAVAQHAVGGLLALLRGLHRAAHAQRERRWEQFLSKDLDSATVVVVGQGPIGQEVVRLIRAFGARTIGVRRTVDDGSDAWPLSRLDEALAVADAVVLALPLTQDTRHLIDERRLSLLGPAAVLINVGRGALVDEAALVDALVSNRLAGAALDVTEVEPLPAESPLWELPTVLLTPHVGGLTSGTERRAAEQFLQNVGCWLSGRPLHNEVESERLVS